MKVRITVLLLSFACLSSVAALCQSNDNDGCSNATLNGDYAFRISGQIMPPTGPTREGVAMTHFDGNGSLTQRDFVMSNGVPLAGPGQTDFAGGETGSYKVDPDCTGTAEIDFPAPPGATTGPVITLKFVLANHGRTIHTIVSKLVGPGGPMPAAIHSDGEKMGVERFKQ